MLSVPVLRVRTANARPLEPSREYVLYWMIAARRPAWNHALDHALACCAALRRPLVIFEPLRAGYPWASDRLHAFVLEGMGANARAMARRGVAYYPYVEPCEGAGKGLLQALAARACLVVTDEFPSFFVPRMIAGAARAVDARLDVVDSNGILPLRAAGKAYPSAAHFRRFAQRVLRDHLPGAPRERPFERIRLPEAPDLGGVARRWPAADASVLAGRTLHALPIDHEVTRIALRGGHVAGRAALRRFVERGLDRYHDAQRHPDANGTSRLSPYLHFGHLSAHEVFSAIMRHERWTLGKLPRRASGAREGWWHVRAGAEAFLDQVIVWRELAFNTSAYRPEEYDKYEALPAWAKATLEAHAGDPRPHVYGLDALERAETHDPLWNAAQRQLRREGWMHNYLRMLWGKKILEWSATPAGALETMTAIMDRWALDGRDPNSYAGYAWTLGRYDRPWPERPVFGKVRAMSTASAIRKVHVREYLQRYGEFS